jgi:hypothetical protein
MITPKEAFDAIKVLWPTTTAIARSELGNVLLVISPSEPYKQSFGVSVAWGTEVMYPKPEPKWRDAKPEDVCYPFKEARFRDRDHHGWVMGRLCGYATNATAKWVYDRGAAFYLCQVRDES